MVLAVPRSELGPFLNLLPFGSAVPKFLFSLFLGLLLLLKLTFIMLLFCSPLSLLGTILLLGASFW